MEAQMNEFMEHAQFMTAQQRRMREYDVTDEPSFATWCKEKVLESRVVKGAYAIDKMYTKTKDRVVRIVNNNPYLIGTVITALYFGFVYSTNVAIEEARAEMLLQTPALPDYEASIETAPVEEENGVAGAINKVKSLFK